MSDERCYSVDIPLSETLMALGKVRSLRDPSTKSMSKFSAFAENMGWETSPYNKVYLGLVSGCQDGGPENYSFLGSQNFSLDARREESGRDPELGFSSRRSGSKLISSKKSAQVGVRGSDSVRTKKVDELDYCRSNGHVVHGNKLSSERLVSKHRDKALDLKCISPYSNQLEDVGSNSELTLGSSWLERIDSTAVNRKYGRGTRTKSSGADADFVRSHVGSPYLSASDNRTDGSSRSTSFFANEDMDDMDGYHQGCGISCCWSRTPRLRESIHRSDFKDHPLLSGEGGELSLTGQEQSCTYQKGEIAPYSDGPRTFCQKFRPRSFNELVGQHVVARSLLSAILRGRIASFYLFHGPRGTGKTSTSRIFAAALNCLSLEEHRPCGSCRECLLFFSGRSRDVKEVDPMKTNQTDRVRSLLKNAALPPVSSQFKVFIIDECQLLHGETWATILNSLEGLPRHIVIIMITADLDKLPRSAVSRCQRYHFQNINDADIVTRLTKICVEENLDFDKVALDFIAARSNGSLREAEMLLDQLSLLGKRITISLAYELIGIVSDDELLDLLDLALSSDTSNTVRRARELMKTRVDPMKLISQLANLIMDILATGCQTGTSNVERNFFGRHTSDANLHKLRHALKILSETEKQLRTSKNQTTWLTVALLLLSSVKSSSLDANDSRVCLRTADKRDDSFCGISSTEEILKHPVSCLCEENNSDNIKTHRDCKGKLETIWRRVIESCQSNTLQSFLQKEGKLASICINQGLAIAEVEFCHPDHISRAEKSWKLIASSLQLVLGCNVDIRINLARCASATKNAKVKKPSLCLLNCSCGMQDRSHSTTEYEVDLLNNSDFTSERATKKEKPIETYSSDCGSQFSPICPHSKEAAIRNDEVSIVSHGSIQHDTPKGSQLGAVSSKEEASIHEGQVFSIQEPENQLSCFSKTLQLHQRLCPSNASKTISLNIQPDNKLEFSIPQKKSFETYFCSSDPYILCSNSHTYSNSSGDEDGQKKESRVNSKLHCWRAPKLPPRKLRQQHRRSQLVGWVLPCATVQ